MLNENPEYKQLSIKDLELLLSNYNKEVFKQVYTYLKGKFPNTSESWIIDLCLQWYLLNLNDNATISKFEDETLWWEYDIYEYKKMIDELKRNNWEIVSKLVWLRAERVRTLSKIAVEEREKLVPGLVRDKYFPRT